MPVGKKSNLKKMVKKNQFFLAYNTPRPPMSNHNNFSPFGPAVWPALGNTYMNVVFYHIDENKNMHVVTRALIFNL